MRILFCGSRTQESSWRVWQTLNELSSTIGTDHTIVHGNARGTDSHAAYYGKKLGFTVEPHPADWDKYGKAAGPIRNREMLESGIDRVYAFTDKPIEESKGTKDMVDIATKAGIHVVLDVRT